MMLPSADFARSAQMRPMTSCTPPAEVGTIRWICLLGNEPCARATYGIAVAASPPARKSRRRIGMLPSLVALAETLARPAGRCHLRCIAAGFGAMGWAAHETGLG